MVFCRAECGPGVQAQCGWERLVIEYHRCCFSWQNNLIYTFFRYIDSLGTHNMINFFAIRFRHLCLRCPRKREGKEQKDRTEARSLFRCHFYLRRVYGMGVPSLISSEALLTTFSPGLTSPRTAIRSPNNGPLLTLTQCAFPFKDVMTNVLSVVVTTLVDGTTSSDCAELTGQSAVGYIPGASVPSLL